MDPTNQDNTSPSAPNIVPEPVVTEAGSVVNEIPAQPVGSVNNEGTSVDPVPQQIPISPPTVQDSNVGKVVAGANESDSTIQDNMRKSVLKMIFGLSIVSLLGVLGIFIFSKANDTSFDTQTSYTNSRATFTVPTSWNENTNADTRSFFNSESVSLSQASLVILKPVKANYDSGRLRQSEIDTITAQYESLLAKDSGGLDFSDKTEISKDGFFKSYNYDLSGLTVDGKTKLRGISLVMFDEENYIHIIEFVALSTYYDANNDQINLMLDSYKITELQ